MFFNLINMLKKMFITNSHRKHVDCDCVETKHNVLINVDDRLVRKAREMMHD